MTPFKVVCRTSSFPLLTLIAVAATACGPAREPVDLVLQHGKIVTVDSTRPEAQAIAIKGDTIVAVGSDREISAFIGGSTRVIDLKGQLAVPGLIEGHGHYMGLGRAKLNLNLSQIKDWDEAVEMVRAAASDARPGDWIQGRGWHQDKWDKTPAGAIEGMPTHQSLSAASPNNPVYLSHASGHAAFVNAKALELAGITRKTRNPPGGEILHDAKGNPTGALKETAQGAVRAVFRKWEDSRPAEVKETEALKMVELAGQEAWSKGITSFQDAGSDFATIDLFKKLADQGKLPVRLYVMVARDPDFKKWSDDLPKYKIINAGHGFLTVRAIKLVADGAMGTRGAWLLKPYDDLPSSVGLATTKVDEMTRYAGVAMDHDFQVNIHAIGDRANREVLDLYEKLIKAHPEKKDLRWRVEHAQHIDPADIPRFGQLGVIAAMQAVHATSDMPWIPSRLGAKRVEEGAYVWQKLMKSGAVVTNGTDVPVEDIDPMASYYASVARKLKDGTVFSPDQRLSREEALRAYTILNAYAAFEENVKGSLKPGKLADITVLSKDILTVSEDEIPTAKAAYTIVAGKVVYQGK